MGHPQASPSVLALAPLRGLRYAEAAVGSLAAVLARPEVAAGGPPAGAAVANHHPLGIAALTGPASGSGPGSRRRAAATLRRWLREGVLAADPVPSLYVCERAGADGVTRGLIGGLRLPEHGSQVVLPHEDVIERIVDEQTRLLHDVRANLEPLLLGYEGGEATAEVTRAAADDEPLTSVTIDGATYRLWAVSDRDRLRLLARDIAGRQALLADGHHRYAASLRLRDRFRTAGHGPGPWDTALAMLVDTSRHPLRVRAIHRVLPALPVAAALDAARPVFRVRSLGPAPSVAAGAEPSEDELAGGAQPGGFLLAGGGELWRLDRPDPAALAAHTHPDRPAAWRELDATVLHSLLFRLWRIAEDDEDVRYHHDVAGALTAARRSGGTAVLLAPPTMATVRALAEVGVRMPRKTTSFGPKPLPGLVLRSFAVG